MHLDGEGTCRLGSHTFYFLSVNFSGRLFQNYTEDTDVAKIYILLVSSCSCSMATSTLGR